MINERRFAHNKGPFTWEINGQQIAEMGLQGMSVPLPHLGVNPKAYPFNAKGDRTTDDSQAFLDAIDSIAQSSRGGHFLQVPPGEYKITRNLPVVSRWFSVVGSGGLAGPNCTQLYVPDSSLDLFTCSAMDSFSLCNLAIWGAGKGTGSGRAVVLGNSGGASDATVFSSQIKDCWITAIPGIAVDLLNAADFRIEGGAVENSSVSVKVHGTTYTQGGGNFMHGVTFFGSTIGVYLVVDAGGTTQYNENTRIQDCFFELCGTNPGGVGDNSNGGIVMDCIDLLRPGIRSPQIVNNHFRGCVGDIRGFGRNGVAANNTGINNPSIKGNHSDRGFRSHITLDGVNGAHIVGNTIDSCNQEGLALCDAVSITGTSDRTFVDGNVTNNLPASPYQPTYGFSTEATTTNTIQGSNRWDGKTGAKNVLGTTLATN